MTLDELKTCILALRERRDSIPALRDYRPQRGKSSPVPQKEVSLDDAFGGLFARGAADEVSAPPAEESKG